MLSTLSCPTHSGSTALRAGHPPATPQFAGAAYLGTARRTAAGAAPVAAGQGNPAAGTAGTSGLGTENSVGWELVPELCNKDQMHNILAVCRNNMYKSQILVSEPCHSEDRTNSPNLMWGLLFQGMPRAIYLN